LVDVVAGWFAGGSSVPYRPRVLANTDLDLAVAFGAAYFGIVRRGGGIRIGGGTARAFYVGIDPESHEQPWLCVVPRDAQEGDRIPIDRLDFELVMGRPVVFPLASSSIRAGDIPGDLVPDDADTLIRLPPLSGLMKASRKARSESVEVQLEAHVTEVGTIELWCHSRTDERRWRLQIQFRAPGRTGSPAVHAPAGSDDGVVIEQALVDAGVDAIRNSFKAPAGTPTNDPGSPARIVKRLESEVQLPREEWPPSLLRALWEPLRECAESRLTSPAHESRWLNLAGYCLRPGTGFPLDEHRIKALWPVFHAGVKHQKDVQCWVEWWVLWRRVAAGLARSHHEEIWRRMGPYLIPVKGGAQAAGKRATRPKPDSHELEQMWRCAASLERLDPTIKVDLGDHLALEGSTRGRASHRYWCLGRLGARVLLYGPANACVPTERASAWLRVILDRASADDRTASDAIFAISQIARVAGDRARDLDLELRTEAIRTLEALGTSEAVIEPVRTYQDLAIAAESEALGDSLPAGLRLRSERPSLEVQNQPT
jgi:hypothetical protein